ncbi:MAG: WYL domain-containing transcriptional regulator [Deltaproteobacteria bacterium]|nr:WYL domain-containing transcriptional regulator [Deltaproteobacteria bacterium]
MKGKFDRLLRILNLLDRERACKPSMLAGELRVTERSVFRYVSSLREAGFPVVFDREKGTYAFENAFKLKKARLNVDETLALAMARKMLGTFGESFARAFDSLERKVLEVCSPCDGLLPSSALVLPTFPAGETPDLSKLLKAMTKASMDRSLVWMTYRSLYSGEETKREVEPYYLFFSPDGFWNLRAYCRMRDGWRTFSLDRVRSWQVLDRYFVPRIFADEVGQEFSRGFGSYLDGDSVRVVVQFTPQIRPYVARRIWHASQENRELPDGGIEMTFTTTGMEALKHWLFRWIPHVRVIEPEELRQEMKGALEAQLVRLREGKPKGKRVKGSASPP